MFFQWCFRAQAPLFCQSVWRKVSGFVFWRLIQIERNSLKMLPAFPLKSVGWSSSSGRLKSGKRHQKNSWLNARYILGWRNQWRNQGSRPDTWNQNGGTNGGTKDGTNAGTNGVTGSGVFILLNPDNTPYSICCLGNKSYNLHLQSTSAFLSLELGSYSLGKRAVTQTIKKL